MTRYFLTAAAALALALPGVASAHSKLVSSTPAANATVAKPTKLSLTFSETFLAPMSSAELVMTGMPGMANHPDMKMTGVNAAIGSDGTSIVMTSAKPLPAGTYRVDWHVVGADTHRITGTHAFSVN